MRLALDTAYSACSAAVSDRHGKVLAACHKEQRRGQAETLAPMIKEVLKKAAVKPSEITEIILTTGPGTFAGVRIATAFARALALATGARVAGFTTLEALAGTVAINGGLKEGGAVLALVPGKRGEVSAELFALEKGTVKSLKGPETMAVGVLKDYAEGKDVIAVGPDLEAYLGQASGLEIKEAISFWPKATDLLALYHHSGKSKLADTVSPFYLRPADAKPQKPGPFSSR